MKQQHLTTLKHFPFFFQHRADLKALGPITWFWLPLLATWLLMAVEGPFIAATIARVPDHVVNLAAFGTSFSMALLLEAPVIMMMSVAPALLKGWQSYLDLRRYCHFLLVLVTLMVGLFLIPTVADFLLQSLLHLPDPVADLVYFCVLLMIPWPAAIGYRRFYQGILIAKGNTKRMTLGTLIRIGAMVGTCLVMSYHLPEINMWMAQPNIWGGPLRFQFSGATIGALALSLGVVIEAATVRFFAKSTLRTLEAQGELKEVLEDSTQSMDSPYHVSSGVFWRFYAPLMLTAFISLGLPPMINFFVGGSYRAIESLAVLPIFNSLAFIFRCFSLSFQDVVLSLNKRKSDLHKSLKLYAAGIGLVTALMLVAITWWPALGNIWLKKVCGLEEHLAMLVAGPLKLLPLYALFSMTLSFTAAQAMLRHKTRIITWASLGEVLGAVVILFIGHLINRFQPDQTWLTGISCAAFAIVFGRGLGALVLAGQLKTVPSS